MELSYREQRANLRAVTPKAPALVAVDLNDERLSHLVRCAISESAGFSLHAATGAVLAAFARHGLPIEHSHNVAPIGDQLPERWYVAVVPEGGGDVA